MGKSSWIVQFLPSNGVFTPLAPQVNPPFFSRLHISSHSEEHVLSIVGSVKLSQVNFQGVPVLAG
jgi:hypothetical protein